jgi:hypothetical protein
METEAINITCSQAEGNKNSGRQIEGYFDFVVPPLEGFWWQEGILGVDYTDKESFNFISVIRLPDFVTKEDFDWAVAEAAEKRKPTSQRLNFSLIMKAYAFVSARWPLRR